MATFEVWTGVVFQEWKVLFLAVLLNRYCFWTENIRLGGYSALIPAGSVIVTTGTRIRLRL
jgi:hypothetical protein